jgi:hypothetical protein
MTALTSWVRAHTRKRGRAITWSITRVQPIITYLPSEQSTRRPVVFASMRARMPDAPPSSLHQLVPFSTRSPQDFPISINI